MSGGTKKRGPASGSRTSRSSNPGQGSTKANGTEPGATVLIAALDGVTGGDGQWTALCPVHGDTETPNLNITVREETGGGRMTVYVHCKRCAANGETVCRKLGLSTQRVFHVGNDVYRNQKPTYEEPISVEKVEGYCDYLWRNLDLLPYLRDDRGLTDATIRKYEVGYDIQRDRYTLPVWDTDGELVNIRRYLPGAEPGEKMKNSPGHGKPARLYPGLPSGKVVVCEGEWDALVLRQHDFPAVTSTHGAETFLDEWVPLFRRRKVAFLYDCDTAGRTAADKHAAKVRKVAREVAVVDLDPFRDDKWDVSDWFNEGRTAAELSDWINAVFTAGGEGRGLA